MADNASQSDRDSYARRARYLPGMLAVAPVGVVVAAAGWHEARMVTVLTATAATLGLPLVLESFVRQQGLAHEVTRLDGSSGMWTTTRMMWPGADSPAERARNAENRRLVEQITDRTLPSTAPTNEIEQAACEAALDEAVAVVRAITRDSSSYPLLRSENAEYGMWRNLRGMRPYGRAIAVLAAIASVALIGLSVADGISSSAADLAVGLLAAVGFGAFWWTIPTDERIRRASQRYALALFDAARLLGYTKRAEQVA